MSRDVTAPTIKQHLRYKYWLLAYGKSRMRCTECLAVLVEEYKAQLSTLEDTSEMWGRDVAELFDAFEPNLISASLAWESFNLGHLIFGESEWGCLRVAAGVNVAHPDDPLTKMFAACSLLQVSSHLKSGVYITLLEDVSFSGKSGKYCDILAYSADKQIWSLTPNFPPNSCAQLGGPHPPATVLGIYKRSEHERHALLFETIIKRSTTDVAIGPLEYCGHGLTMCATSGTIIPVLCHADPAIPPALLEREY
ncbi:hypothetical protein PAXINDRAFT_17508 [Paxillus involutus ATCC 200175]|uniref:Uncharacterized protein n=1 Tax=Paxillus involutus ATCC 200175 TaxID=664439 RepID=A0A0C9TEK6_PAXIN|nr:hypothetical protein PAXINDRAFT_17508 [Paxillus involutus ATCC 200175]